MIRRVLALVLLGWLSLPGIVQAHEHYPAERRTYPYDAQIPQCADPSVTARLAEYFHLRESTYWNSGLTIRAFDKLREIGWRPNGLEFIPRRYCHGRVHTSDGHIRPITYSIIEDATVVGMQGSLGPLRLVWPTPSTFGLDWCIQGLERNRSHGGDCRAARP
jgi:hypothetical protein